MGESLALFPSSLHMVKLSWNCPLRGVDQSRGSIHHDHPENSTREDIEYCPELPASAQHGFQEESCHDAIQLCD